LGSNPHGQTVGKGVYADGKRHESKSEEQLTRFQKKKRILEKARIWKKSLQQALNKKEKRCNWTRRKPWLKKKVLPQEKRPLREGRGRSRMSCPTQLGQTLGWQPTPKKAAVPTERNWGWKRDSRRASELNKPPSTKEKKKLKVPRKQTCSLVQGSTVTFLLWGSCFL